MIHTSLLELCLLVAPRVMCVRAPSLNNALSIAEFSRAHSLARVCVRLQIRSSCPLSSMASSPDGAHSGCDAWLAAPPTSEARVRVRVCRFISSRLLSGFLHTTLHTALGDVWLDQPNNATPEHGVRAAQHSLSRHTTAPLFIRAFLSLHCNFGVRAHVTRRLASGAPARNAARSQHAPRARAT